MNCSKSNKIHDIRIMVCVMKKVAKLEKVVINEGVNLGKKINHMYQ